MLDKYVLSNVLPLDIRKEFINSGSVHASDAVFFG
jgi:hypothetical protein